MNYNFYIFPNDNKTDDNKHLTITQQKMGLNCLINMLLLLKLRF